MLVHFDVVLYVFAFVALFAFVVGVVVVDAAFVNAVAADPAVAVGGSLNDGDRWVVAAYAAVFLSVVV